MRVHSAHRGARKQEDHRRHRHLSRHYPQPPAPHRGLNAQEDFLGARKRRGCQQNRDGNAGKQPSQEFDRMARSTPPMIGLSTQRGSREIHRYRCREGIDGILENLRQRPYPHHLQTQSQKACRDESNLKSSSRERPASCAPRRTIPTLLHLGRHASRDQEKLMKAQRTHHVGGSANQKTGLQADSRHEGKRRPKTTRDSPGGVDRVNSSHHPIVIFQPCENRLHRRQGCPHRSGDWKQQQHRNKEGHCSLEPRAWVESYPAIAKCRRPGDHEA